MEKRVAAATGIQEEEGRIKENKEFRVKGKDIMKSFWVFIKKGKNESI